jgi:hypothetical protein
MVCNADANETISSSSSSSSSSCLILLNESSSSSMNNTTNENDDVSEMNNSNSYSTSWSTNFIPMGISHIPSAVWYTSRQFVSFSTSLIHNKIGNIMEELFICISNSNSSSNSCNEWKINWKVWEQQLSVFIFRIKCLIYFSLTMLMFYIFISAL